MLLSFLIDRPSLVGIRVQVDVDESLPRFGVSLNGRKGAIDLIEVKEGEHFIRVKLDKLQAEGSGYVEHEGPDTYWLHPMDLRTL